MSASFGARLLRWYAQHGRKDLPWQHEPTPYRVWVSEIMLQQTQVATVIPYYRQFLASFPDVTALADADEDAVLHLWSGLGYYARARNLHRAAVIVRDRHAGVFPDTYDALIALPGIGRSTAGAILALSLGQRHPILDGNVKRVIARYHAVDGWPGRQSVAKELWRLSESHLPGRKLAEYTQAIMDLGATVCTRSKPDCAACPVSPGCSANSSGRQADYPGRKPASEKPLKSTSMLLAHCGGALYLERRPPTGIWGSLWSLPELEGADDVRDWCQSRLDSQPLATERWRTVRHSFTHYDLDIQPIAVRLDPSSRRVADTDTGRWYALDGAPRIGLAAPVRKLIDRLVARGGRP